MQPMIFVTFLLAIIEISQYGEASSVGSAQYNHNHNHTHHEALKCYSCISIQNFPNMSAEGCGKSHPPDQYITEDCFGYNSPQALAAIRHASGSDQPDYNVDPLNVHCVHIKGNNAVGGDIHVRGCLALPTGEVFPTKTCRSRKDLNFIGLGHVHEVEYCFCNGQRCNGGTSIFLQNSFLANALLLGIAAVNKILEI